jgi:hypothetical protein
MIVFDWDPKAEWRLLKEILPSTSSSPFGLLFEDEGADAVSWLKQVPLTPQAGFRAAGNQTTF